MSSINVDYQERHKTAVEASVPEAPQNAMRSIETQINKTAMVAIKKLLSDLYTNPATAVLREYVSNAIDAHQRSTEVNTLPPILINYSRDGLSFRDYGVGMSITEIEENYGMYGNSSKADDNSQIGSYGIGSKVALSVASRFIVTTVKNEQRVKFSVDLDKITILEETPAPGEVSGTLIEIRGEDFNSNNSSMSNILTELKRMQTYPDHVLGGAPSKSIQVKIFGEEFYAVTVEDVAFHSIPLPEYGDGTKVLFYPHFKAFETGEKESNSYGDNYMRNHNRSTSFLSVNGVMYEISRELERYLPTNVNYTIQAGPGFVDFNSSRESITHNSRYTDFLKKSSQMIRDSIVRPELAHDAIVKQKLFKKDAFFALDIEALGGYRFRGEHFEFFPEDKPVMPMLPQAANSYIFNKDPHRSRTKKEFIVVDFDNIRKEIYELNKGTYKDISVVYFENEEALDKAQGSLFGKIKRLDDGLKLMEVKAFEATDATEEEKESKKKEFVAKSNYVLATVEENITPWIRENFKNVISYAELNEAVKEWRAANRGIKPAQKGEYNPVFTMSMAFIHEDKNDGVKVREIKSKNIQLSETKEDNFPGNILKKLTKTYYNKDGEDIPIDVNKVKFILDTDQPFLNANASVPNSGLFENDNSLIHFFNEKNIDAVMQISLRANYSRPRFVEAFPYEIISSDTHAFFEEATKSDVEFVDQSIEAFNKLVDEHVGDVLKRYGSYFANLNLNNLAYRLMTSNQGADNNLTRFTKVVETIENYIETEAFTPISTSEAKIASEIPRKILNLLTAVKETDIFVRSRTARSGNFGKILVGEKVDESMVERASYNQYSKWVNKNGREHITKSINYIVKTDVLDSFSYYSSTRSSESGYAGAVADMDGYFKLNNLK